MSGHESTDVIFHVMGCEILPHISLDMTLPKILAIVSGPISYLILSDGSASCIFEVVIDRNENV